MQILSPRLNLFGNRGGAGFPAGGTMQILSPRLNLFGNRGGAGFPAGGTKQILSPRQPQVKPSCRKGGFVLSG